MTSRIRIKLGPIEVEYEGPEAFLKEELPDLLAAVARLHRDAGESLDAGGDGDDGSGASGAGDGAGGRGLKGTTKTFAARLACKSGSDLALAAAAQLTIVQGKDSFKRSTLHDEMRSASPYYKKSYANNLTKYLDGLVGAGKFVEPAKGNLSLSADELKQLKGRLASK